METRPVAFTYLRLLPPPSGRARRLPRRRTGFPACTALGTVSTAASRNELRAGDQHNATVRVKLYQVSYVHDVIGRLMAKTETGSAQPHVSIRLRPAGATGGGNQCCT